MIGYSSFLTPDNKKETEEVLKLIGLTFGEEEEMLERRQLCGEESEYNADYLFSTVQTMSKDEVYSRFDKEHFDYGF